MLEFILAKTNLPNLHPAIVHFPLVLLLVALALDIAALFLTSRVWLKKSALLLWVLGAIAAGATFLSGRQAATTVDVPRQAEALLARHENFALYTLWFFGIYAVIRIALEFASDVPKVCYVPKVGPCSNDLDSPCRAGSSLPNCRPRRRSRLQTCSRRNDAKDERTHGGETVAQ